MKNKITFSRLFMAAALMGLSAVSFAQSSGSNAGGSTGENEAQSAASVTNPTDPQIAAIAQEANNVDIDNGKYAKKRTRDKTVREFANDMIRDHSSVNDQANQLMKKLNVKPEENDTSKGLKTEGAKMRDALKKTDKNNFDKAYVDAEVNFHQEVLNSLDRSLIPNAKNPELKALLEKARPTVEEHLKHAQMLQASLGKKHL